MKISFCFFCPHCQWANLKVLNLKFFFFNVRNVDGEKKLKGDMGKKKTRDKNYPVYNMPPNLQKSLFSRKKKKMQVNIGHTIFLGKFFYLSKQV